MGAAFAKPLSSPRYPPATAEEAAPLALDGDRVPSGSGVHPSPSAGGTSCSRRRRCCPPPVPAIVALNTIFEIRLPLNGRRMPKQSSIKKVHLQDLSEDRVALRYQSLSQWWQPKSTKRPSNKEKAHQKKALYGCECRGRNTCGSRALRTKMRRQSHMGKRTPHDRCTSNAFAC